MCRLRNDLKSDERLDAVPPLAGALVAFVSLLIVLAIIAR